MSSTATSRRWSERLDQQDASGLTCQAFALEIGVNPNTLASWRSKLGRARPRQRTDFVELVVNEIKPTTGHTTLILELEDYPARFTIDADTNLPLLRRVLEALC